MSTSNDSSPNDRSSSPSLESTSAKGLETKDTLAAPLLPGQSRPTPFSFVAAMKNLCPSCHKGKITEGILGMKKRCPHCDYDLHPENGYYLGAMMVGFFVVSALTIPPVIFLKVTEADEFLLITYPFLQYLILGPLLLHYSKVIWAHLGYWAGHEMNKNKRR